MFRALEGKRKQNGDLRYSSCFLTFWLKLEKYSMFTSQETVEAQQTLYPRYLRSGHPSPAEKAFQGCKLCFSDKQFILRDHRGEEQGDKRAKAVISSCLKH